MEVATISEDAERSEEEEAEAEVAPPLSPRFGSASGVWVWDGRCGFGVGVVATIELEAISAEERPSVAATELAGSQSSGSTHSHSTH